MLTGLMLMPIADGPEKGFPQRQSGKRRQEGQIKGHSPGETSSEGKTRTHLSLAKRIQCLSEVLKKAKALMAFMTWLETYGNGQQTGFCHIRGTPILMKIMERYTGLLEAGPG